MPIKTLYLIKLRKPNMSGRLSDHINVFNIVQRSKTPRYVLEQMYLFTNPKSEFDVLFEIK